jgi:hypothetical protein
MQYADYFDNGRQQARIDVLFSFNLHAEWDT